MSDEEYLKSHFSATMMTEDAAVLHVLRALCQHCYAGKYKQIAWGGTGEREWRSNENCVTFRFQSPSERERFLTECARLLDASLWRLVKTSDSDPAERQRR
ncbi:hypothetical protein [Nocardioides luteus]|uniref:Uncharacterized protein n=1 Tax=Nocardioides luteus TaxID=1844 RepID=A0A1J4N0X2_9ACTN|nr:hypothetical protein [Nocardioides luteus]OIJ25237.1 hypothetical protein UG56_018555 [Nocardioides luteus]